MNNKRNINIHVPVLTRVEGEGALDLEIRNGQITQLKLRIFEPPRYFEKFLEGRHYQEVIDIVARICGICPVAYQMSATQALESLFELQVSPWVNKMRHLLYCGEWIQSHSLHIHLLAAPDFLGCNNIIELSAQHPEVVQRGLRLQDLGNKIIQLLGGRSVHPVGARVGGFYKAPAIEAAQDLLNQLKTCSDDCLELIQWTCSLELPNNPQTFTSVAMHNDSEYPILHGRLISSNGLDIDIEEFEQHFSEHQVAHSTALHALLHNEPYLTGPLARLNLNPEHVPAPALAILQQAGIHLPSNDMFHSIIARAVEIYIAIHNAIHILQDYTPTDTPFLEPTLKAGSGIACTEAPRGFLWHQYRTDAQGSIEYARIVPPTSQNQAQIEQDLARSINHFGTDRNDDEIRQYAETIIRNYDPCISCATHFLQLKIHREQ